MNEDYEIAKYRPEHKTQVVELQKQLWSSDARLNWAYLEWKYEQNPYLDEIPIYLALFRGDVVGMRGLFGGRWEAGLPRQEFPTICADDLVISVEHRNRGLFTRIMSAAFENVAASRDGYALSLSGSLTTVLGSLTMGWKSIGMMQPVGWESKSVRRLRRIRAVISKTPLLWKYAEAPWLAASREEERFARLDANAQTASREASSVWLEREPKPEAMAELVQALGTDGRIRHVRDAQYFAWRLRNPLHEYRFLYAGGSELTGYLVLRRSVSNHADPARVHISDWEATDTGVKEALLRAALAWGEFARLVTWTATSSQDTCRILRESGFVDVDLDLAARGCPCVLVRPVRVGKSEPDWTIAGRHLLDLSSWDLRMLYSMYG